ncbi:MAG: universal stress protein [Gemmatimonadota bacterium]|jgi:nucleotide-binding universal stress UspA family protein
MSAARGGVGPATLLVGISNPATVEELVRLSAKLAEAGHWKILLTHVVTVANQISLTTGRSSTEVVRARDLLQEVLSRAEATGMDVGALVEVARSVDEGLLAAADSHHAEMILVGYSEAETEADDGGTEERFDRTMHRVARKGTTDTVVAKFRREGMGRILVPVAADAPLQVTGLLCRALGRAAETSLTFLHVVESGASMDEARRRIEGRLEERGVASIGPLIVVASQDPVEAIVETAAEYDLMIVGPSRRPGLMKAIFSSRAQKIAEEAPTSVLLVWNRAVGAG